MEVPDGLFRGVVETVPMEVAILDAAGDIVYTNDRWQQFGIENGLAGDPSTVGENYLAVLDAADGESPADDIDAAIRAVLDGDDSVHQFEYPCHSPSVPRWFAMYVTRMELDGEPFVHLGHVDITQRKLAELDVRDRNERLSTVARVLSHDLRNPLNVASADAELLGERGADEETLDDLRNALSRMEAIIEDALVLARGTELHEMDAVSLEQAAVEAWGYVETGTAELVVESDLAFVADAGLLSNLFENLFRNSVEHGATSQQSESSGGATGAETTDGVTVRVGPLPDRDGFYVADDGPGIPSNIADQVFEAGFTTGSESTGFGLAIVDAVAAAHGWTVTLADGDGARFEFGSVDVLAASGDEGDAFGTTDGEGS